MTRVNRRLSVTWSSLTLILTLRLPVLGVTLAMEEKRANGAEIDDGAINGIKVGLMGPLAGVGDPIFWASSVQYSRRWAQVLQ